MIIYNRIMVIFNFNMVRSVTMTRCSTFDISISFSLFWDYGTYKSYQRSTCHSRQNTSLALGRNWKEYQYSKCFL